MQYRRDGKSGADLSAIGFGCMRFARGVRGIDMARAQALILEAVRLGVNYFDTAYIYPGSEEALGEILEKNGLRDRVYIATKLPLITCKRKEDFDRYFHKQLERLRTDHIDYYLMHMLVDESEWRRLCAWGIEEWIAEKKASGAIRRIGFSFHGGQEAFLKLLEVYPWEFCQIQYNYYSPSYQAGVTGLKKAAEMGLPVIIMEPLLGGRLANLPADAGAVFDRLGAGAAATQGPDARGAHGTGESAHGTGAVADGDPGGQPVGVVMGAGTGAPRTYAGWGMAWLLNQPEVTCILSGMNAMEQLIDNVRTADSVSAGSLSEMEMAAYAKARELLHKKRPINCTSCGYCQPCPSGVNVPACFSAYNTSFSEGWVSGVRNYMMSCGMLSDVSTRASRCTGCGACEAHCPQNIAIRDSLKKVRKRLEPAWLNMAAKVARKAMQHR
jgi:predicted aldo/keto reductase-like oxidoreductase